MKKLGRNLAEFGKNYMWAGEIKAPKLQHKNRTVEICRIWFTF